MMSKTIDLRNPKVDHPLPPMSPEMRLADASMLMPADETSWQEVPGFGFELRDPGFGQASNGLVGARVIKATGPCDGGVTWHMHHLGIHLAYILKGWGLFEFEGIGQVRLEAGTAMYQPPMNRHRELDRSEDFEAIEFVFPANALTTMFVWDEERGEYGEAQIDENGRLISIPE